MSLHILRNGLLDSIQDGGRYGYQHLGINPGGAMDTIAMRVANMLVGNDPNEAVIEMHFPAAEIQFEQTMLMSLAGADFTATINGEAAPLLHPIMVQKGSILRFKQQQNGARVYLAVEGGFMADDWLGSYSTNLVVKAGGYKGRALQKNDHVTVKQEPLYTFFNQTHPLETLPWSVNISENYRNGSIRFIEGAEYELLSDVSKKELVITPFSITGKSNLMGYRLEGEPMKLIKQKEMISSAVTRGTIQLLPGGQLIILMADHQTTGGYPRVGHIISADIPSLAQMGARDKFTLQKTTIEQAEKIFLEQEMNLRQLQNACNFRLNEYLNS
jgi:antagonist of KipI